MLEGDQRGISLAYIGGSIFGWRPPPKVIELPKMIKFNLYGEPVIFDHLRADLA